VRNFAPAQRVFGIVDFRQLGYGPVEMKYRLVAFDDRDNMTVHGMHIHQYGDISQYSCDNSGPHYNPLQVHHGGLEDSIFNKHLGDLGNVEEDSEGRMEGRIFTSDFGLHGKWDINGRLLTLSIFPDDLGREDNEGSKMDGNTGGSLGCCIVNHSDARGWKTD